MAEDIIDEYNGILDSRYFVPHYAFSAPTSIQTPNQIAEVTARLNAGVTGVDLALIYADMFEQVPRQHFQEIGRLTKLTGAKASIHGPIERGISDLAGFEQGRWSELNRKDAERKISYFIDRAHDLDEKGNTPINFHINTNIEGEHWRKLKDEELAQLKQQAAKMNERERAVIKPYIDRGEVMERMGIVDLETGQYQSIPAEVKHYPGGDIYYTPERRLNALNEGQWDQDRLRIFEYQRQKALVEERKARLATQLLPYEYGARHHVLSDQEQKQREQLRQQVESLNSHVSELDKHIHLGLNDLYHRFSYLPKEEKPKVDSFLKQIEKDYSKLEEDKRRFERELFELRESKNIEKKARIISEYEKRIEEQDSLLQSRLNSVGQPGSQVPTPVKFIPTNTLAKEKTVDTVSNAIYDSYKKYKEYTPIITIENYWYNRTLGTASELKDVINKSREKFVEKLVKNEGMSKETAKKTAEKLIGVTWDVGHIELVGAGGCGGKKGLEESCEIGPYVKQLHITDNFGFNDSHLPPGMGNAPIKQEIEELKKKGFKFEKGNLIVEAGGWFPQFNENPHPYAMEYFNSPLYTYKSQPNWYNIWETQGPYNLGYGDILPDIHFRELYGAGFSNLPPELGGQRGAGSDRGRFATSGQ